MTRNFIRWVVDHRYPIGFVVISTITGALCVYMEWKLGGRL